MLLLVFFTMYLADTTYHTAMHIIQNTETTCPNS